MVRLPLFVGLNPLRVHRLSRFCLKFLWRLASDGEEYLDLFLVAAKVLYNNDISHVLDLHKFSNPDQIIVLLSKEGHSRVVSNEQKYSWEDLLPTWKAVGNAVKRWQIRVSC